MRRWFLSLATGIALAGLAVHAHHAISAHYDSARSVTVDGLVAQFQFISPHPMLTVTATGRDGASVAWRMEMDNRSELSRIGMTADTFKPGDRVIVVGSLAREQPNSLYIRRLERPADALLYEQVGNSPRIRSSAR